MGVSLSQMILKTINIAEIISPDLGFRTQARGFRQFVDENYAAKEAVMIDFSGVQFASRAFMDEFYNLFFLPSATASFPVKVEVVNLPADIAAILEAVARTNTQPRVHSADTEPEVSEVKFESVKEMAEYFGDSTLSNYGYESNRTD